MSKPKKVNFELIERKKTPLFSPADTGDRDRVKITDSDGKVAFEGTVEEFKTVAANISKRGRKMHVVDGPSTGAEVRQ